jgi:hypothetical protein
MGAIPRDNRGVYTMKFRTIEGLNSDLTQRYAYDSLAGIAAIVAICEDKSGYVGRVLDYHTGEKMGLFVGSTQTIVEQRIVDYTNSLMTNGIIGS